MAHEFRRVGGLNRVALKSPLARDYPQGTVFEAVQETAVAGPARLSKRAVDAGATALLLDNRSGLSEGDVLRIGLAADAAVEYAQLKLLPETASIPVIMLTAKVQAKKQELVSKGAAGVLVKPFDPMRLPDQLCEILGWSVARKDVCRNGSAKQ